MKKYLTTLLIAGLAGCDSYSGVDLRNFVDKSNLDSGVLIDDESGCVNSNGVWGMWGLQDHQDGTNSCNVRANDAGNVCYSQDECEGACIAELCLPRDEDCEPASVGRCSEYRRVFGCHDFIGEGSVCVD